MTNHRYYQPNPNATIPFPPVASLNDPYIATSLADVAFCNSAGQEGLPCNGADGWGLRVLNSDNILVYGAGLYSFFDNYNVCKPPIP